HRGSVQFQNAALRQQFGEPRNFQNFQRTGTLPANLQGTQQGTHTFQNTLQGTQQLHIQSNQGTTLQGNQSRGGTGPLNTKLNTNTNVNTNPNTKLNTNTNVNTNPNTKLNTNSNTNTHFNTNANINPNVNRN